MKYRRLGATDLTVSEIGFGCARLGGIFGNASRSELLGTVRKAADQGITFFDTADMYCQGESEQLLGAAFRRDRDRVVIASKVGYRLPTQRKAAARIKPLLRPIVHRLGLQRAHLPSRVSGSLSQDFRPAYIVRAAEQSLKRLQTDYLDLYQLHSPPRDILESGDFLAPLEELKRHGKARYYGVSCETIEDARVCLRYPQISSLQVRLSLLDQSALTDVIPRAAERQVAIIARECFAGGLLAKPLDALNLEQFIPDEVEREMRRSEVTAFHQIAQCFHRPTKQLALRFLLDLESVAVVLLGMRTQAHLSDNLEHLAASPLSREEREAVHVGAASTAEA